MRTLRGAVGLWCFLLLVAGMVMAGALPMREEALKYFAPEEIARGRAYAGGRYLLFGVRTVLQVGFFALFLLPPVSQTARGLFLSWSGGRPWLHLLLYAGCLLLLYRLLLLPVDLYGGYIRERAYGLSTQSVGGWFTDWGKGFLVQALLLLPTISLIYLLIRRDPVRWFLPAGVGVGGLVLLLTFLAPILLDPLFHNFTPLEDQELKSRVLRLAERAGIPVEQVLVADASRRTVKANAYVTGLGETKRIVLYDTLLKRAAPEEVEVVLAHEMGHRLHHHIWKGVGLSILAAFLGLGITSVVLRWGAVRGVMVHPADPAGLPLFILALLTLTLLILPIQNSISRHFERQADLSALHLSRNREAYIKVEVDLARSNLADITPPRWAVLLLYTHPPVLERIALAEAPLTDDR